MVQIGLAYGFASRDGFQKVDSLLSLQSTLPPPGRPKTFSSKARMSSFSLQKKATCEISPDHKSYNDFFCALLITKSEIVHQADENEH